MRCVVVTVSLLAVSVATVFRAHDIRLLEGRTARYGDSGLEQKTQLSMKHFIKVQNDSIQSV